ncbi:putative glucose-6-phosphatase 2-like [Apostichopus japonicus]|uniref:Glucose-6-phosphatase n=1 Tax=Stichopus japonicus TaxID=307972 RepID=A0A2G8KD49_STIJA|nr:putative glucose-6-phosphatase 2-like [Apostichopus japonicus]
MAGRMDSLHFHEIKAVEFLQYHGMEFKETLQFISHLGGPNNSFLIYFPIAYILNHAVGLKILWAAVFSEWFNASLKWLLFGHRPYWWVRESNLYNDQNRPDIEQFPSTCETGPGSPSGHMMVTVAIWYIITKETLSHIRSSRERSGRELPLIVDITLWSLFGVFVTLVGVGRVFIATHFPNQVVLGLLVGLLIGHIVSQLPVHTFTLLNYLTGSMFLLQAVVYQYLFMFLLNHRPDWSIALAAKWCGDPAWVHLDSTPFYAVSRDIGSLFFTGLALRYIGSKVTETSRGLLATAILAAVAVFAVHGVALLTLPTKYEFLFYALGAFKEGLVPIIVIGLNVIYESVLGKRKVM